jgi:cell division protein FtsW
VAADLAERYYDEQVMGFTEFVKNLAVFVGVPLALILLQPDKGSTLIIGATLIVMGYLAGMDRRWILLVLGVGIVGVLAISLKDDYSRARIVAMSSTPGVTPRAPATSSSRASMPLARAGSLAWALA